MAVKSSGSRIPAIFAGRGHSKSMLVEEGRGGEGEGAGGGVILEKQTKANRGRGT